jgi:hypothetical protein
MFSEQKIGVKKKFLMDHALPACGIVRVGKVTSSHEGDRAL